MHLLNCVRWMLNLMNCSRTNFSSNKSPIRDLARWVTLAYRMTQRVFVDANVFYSRTHLDWLFFLKQANNAMFQLHSTEDVFAEVRRIIRTEVVHDKMTAT